METSKIRKRMPVATLLDPQIVVPAIGQAFVKLNLATLIKNPVMFVLEVVTALTTVILIRDLFTGGGNIGFEFQIVIWLWFTVLFANFAEAVAEGRGKAQAETLRKARTETRAKRIQSPRTYNKFETIPADKLRAGDLVVCEAGDIIPGDGDVIEGIASVNEAAITGESAPVIRESGGDRSAVTGGTTVISDRIIIRITSSPGSSFLDRMIKLVEGAERQKTPNEIALDILLVGLTIIFVFATATIPSYVTYAGGAVSVVILVALFVTLIPTTIGALLSAIGIAGMDRLVRFNVLAMSGRAVEAAGDVDTLLLDKTGTGDSEVPAKTPRFRWPTNFARTPLHFLYAALAVAAALGIGEILTWLTPIPNLSMVFLLAVLVTAMSFGIWPAIFASVLSFLVYNFFFIPPQYTFTIAEPYELLALVIFLVVAVVSSALAGRVREQARIAANRMRAMRRLYEFTRRLSGLATLDGVAEGAASEIHASLGRPVVVLLAQNDDLALTAAWPPEDTLDAAAMTAARWAYNHVEPAGADTGTLPIIPWYFVPLRIGSKTLGVVGIAKEKGAPPIDSEARALLETLVEQAAAALERASLAREMVSAKTATETERVRNTLLASVSHDFRTPLSSILGSATSLMIYGEKLDATAKKDLLGQIKKEAEDLDEMVRNLLAITRIDAGALELRRDWIDLREIADRVVSAARRHGAQQQIEISLPTHLPLVRADATLVEQAIGNVVGNAVLHTPPQTHVQLDADVAPSAIALRVSDNGPGIPADRMPHIFEKFVKGAETRASRADGSQGTGLGLAIAKGIMEAHGGEIKVESPVMDGRGARFVMTFPREATQA